MLDQLVCFYSVQIKEHRLFRYSPQSWQLSTVKVWGTCSETKKQAYSALLCTPKCNAEIMYLNMRKTISVVICVLTAQVISVHVVLEQKASIVSLTFKWSLLRFACLIEIINLHEYRNACFHFPAISSGCQNSPSCYGTFFANTPIQLLSVSLLSSLPLPHLCQELRNPLLELSVITLLKQKSFYL